MRGRGSPKSSCSPRFVKPWRRRPGNGCPSWPTSCPDRERRRYGGPPSARSIQQGDLIPSGLVPRCKVYGGDTCNTCVVGEPMPEQRKISEGIADALAAAISKVWPGVRVDDLDAEMRLYVLRLRGGATLITAGMAWESPG